MASQQNEVNNLDDEHQDGEDIWNNEGGYSPLDQLNGDVIFSTGADGYILASNPLEFYSNLGDFDSDKESKEEYNFAADIDFDAIANQALSSLEEDYRRTIEAEPQRLPERDPDLNLPPITLVHEQEFVANFTENQETAEASPARPFDVDTDAVKRAVQSISLKDPKLKAGFEEWEANSKWSEIPDSHPIIPATPLSAFGKRTEKARNATLNLSRSASIAEALARLNLVGTVETLRIHVIGCDDVECSSDDRIRTYFGPIVRWLQGSAQSIELHLIGPSIAKSRDGTKVDLIPKVALKLKSAFATVSSLPYEEYAKFNSTPNLAIAFNAGIWGYSDWKPAIQAMTEYKNLSLIITAYTIEECEDDNDSLREILLEEAFKQLWGPELNPYASRKDRETKSAPKGRRYRESAAWQAIQFL